MGIPLQECKQQFCFMSDKMKTRLRNHLVEPAIQAGLDDILFETFSLQIGYSRRFTAADLAHSITALLESQGKAPGEWETAFFRVRYRQHAMRSAPTHQHTYTQTHTPTAYHVPLTT